MATTDLTAVPSPSSPVRRVTTLGVLRSEWTKFWSLRSSAITLGVGLLLLVAFGAITAFTYTPTADTFGAGPDSTSSPDAISLALSGMNFAPLALGVLGVLAGAGEYTTGTVRSTLLAVPKRLPVLWSKAAVIGTIALVVSTVGVLVAFSIGMFGLDGQPIALSLGDDGVLRGLLGAGLYLGLVAMFGVALGSLIRSTAGGIAALVGVTLLLPVVAIMLPNSFFDTVGPYFFSNAGEAVYSLTESAGSLSPGAGLAVLAGWVAVVLAAAAFRLKRTDA
ncbi:ABC transporter permease [Acrocarpospora pleiomorpha]|uniref:ABC transporter permease n=1 Tax=Acrocarpospora pleiomorpha TaxID=90975 RepID=A0A5M3XM70_9ACTN|nr:ABC transporter permease [Acrocarpospora pleiomorpha]GES19268.1 ABC transporter permease [Acrocarpospora pleiomorpha]